MNNFKQTTRSFLWNMVFIITYIVFGTLISSAVDAAVGPALLYKPGIALVWRVFYGLLLGFFFNYNHLFSLGKRENGRLRFSIEYLMFSGLLVLLVILFFDFFVPQIYMMSVLFGFFISRVLIRR